jgi:hypothetical protein
MPLRLTSDSGVQISDGSAYWDFDNSTLKLPDPDKGAAGGLRSVNGVLKYFNGSAWVTIS